jgi:hypothetical protein
VLLNQLDYPSIKENRSVTDNESMFEEGGYNFEIEAGWERDGDDYRCRWCVISRPLNEDDYGRIAGVGAGYSGGGTFEVERFYLEIDDDGEATKLIIESGHDAINDPDREGEGIDWFSDMDEDVREAAEAAYILLLRWNDEDAWGNDDQLHLRADKLNEPELQEDDDMLRIRTDDEPYPRWVCDAIGLSASPSFDDDD